MAALTRYGKIVNGEFESAPLNLEVEGHVVCNVFLHPEILERFGYKPIVSDPLPEYDPEEPEHTVEPSYTDEGDYIRESFTVIDGEGVE